MTNINSLRFITSLNFLTGLLQKIFIIKLPLALAVPPFPFPPCRSHQGNDKLQTEFVIKGQRVRARFPPGGGFTESKNFFLSVACNLGNLTPLVNNRRLLTLPFQGKVSWVKVPEKSSIYYHFKEFKLRMGYLVFSFLTTFLICYYYSFEILYLFVKPLLNYNKNFIFTDLTEAFYTTIQLNLIVSIYMLIPFIMYHIWCFYIPSTFLEERKKYNFFFSAVIILLCISLTFIYCIVLPELYKFLLHFEISTNFMSIQLEARIQSYVKLACKIFLLFSIVFQIPLLFLILLKHGYITSRFLIKNRWQILFVNLLLAAFLSPPDLVFQIVLALCFQIVFEILLLTTFLYKKLK